MSGEVQRLSILGQLAATGTKRYRCRQSSSPQVAATPQTVTWAKANHGTGGLAPRIRNTTKGGLPVGSQPNAVWDGSTHPLQGGEDHVMSSEKGASTAFVLAALGTACLGVLLFVWLGIPWGGPGLSDQRSADEAGPARDPGSNLTVTVSSCEANGDSLWTDGMVRNDGGVVVRYVEIALSWLDASGSPVDSHVVFAVDGETFTPGDSAFFRAATAVPLASDCAARLFSYEPL